MFVSSVQQQIKKQRTKCSLKAASDIDAADAGAAVASTVNVQSTLNRVLLCFLIRVFMCIILFASCQLTISII